MSSVAIQDWRVSVADLSGVVEDNDLKNEKQILDSRLNLESDSVSAHHTSMKKLPPFFDASIVQVDFFQKHLFLNQLTHNMTKRLFIDLPIQYMKTTSSEHWENMLCA